MCRSVVLICINQLDSFGFLLLSWTESRKKGAIPYTNDVGFPLKLLIAVIYTINIFFFIVYLRDLNNMYSFTYPAASLDNLIYSHLWIITQSILYSYCIIRFIRYRTSCRFSKSLLFIKICRIIYTFWIKSFKFKPSRVKWCG